MASPTATNEATPDPQVVGNVFVEQYYHMLHLDPGSVHKFYKDSSWLTRPNSVVAGATVTAVQGQAAINDLIMSLGYYRGCVVEIETNDTQLSLNNAVFILVSGYLTAQDKIRRKFSQSFYLSFEGKGVYFVLNDMLRFVAEAPPVQLESLPNGSTNNVSYALQEPVLDLQEAVPMPDSPVKEPTPPQSETVAEKSEKNSVAAVKEDAPGKPVVLVAHVSVEPSVPAPVSEVAQPFGQKEAEKKSYASILVKGKASSAATALPTTKGRPARPAPAKPANAPAKSLPTVAKPAPATDGSAASITPELEKQSSPDVEGYSVFIRNLPPNATPDQVRTEFNKFGSITADGVQVRRHQFDGFCFGFVEFETQKSMLDAIQASPVIIADHQVLVDQKRTTTRVRNGVAVGGGLKDRYPQGNGGFREGFRGNFGPGRNDFRNMGGNFGPGRGQGFNPRFQNGDNRMVPAPFQNGNGRMGQQRSFQNGNARMGQQRPFQNGNGRITQTRPVQNGDGPVRQPSALNQGNRPKEVIVKGG